MAFTFYFEKMKNTKKLNIITFFFLHYSIIKMFSYLFFIFKTLMIINDGSFIYCFIVCDKYNNNNNNNIY